VTEAASAALDHDDPDASDADDLDLIPYPQIVPAPDPSTLGQHLSTFACWLTKATFDKHGNVIVSFRVDASDKYAALPLTDVAGKRFTVLVHAPQEWQPVVEAGVMRVHKVRSSRKAKLQKRMKVRRWRTVRRVFVGWDGPWEMVNDDEH
jgi:hypothetical protein